MKKFRRKAILSNLIEKELNEIIKFKNEALENENMDLVMSCEEDLEEYNDLLYMLENETLFIND